MIRTNLQRLIPPHNQSCLSVLLVLQQPHIARPTLLPLPTITIEFEQLGAHFESLLLQLFIRLGLDFLGKVYDRLEVDFWRFYFFLLRIRKPTGQQGPPGVRPVSGQGGGPMTV